MEEQTYYCEKFERNIVGTIQDEEICVECKKYSPRHYPYDCFEPTKPTGRLKFLRKFKIFYEGPCSVRQEIESELEKAAKKSD